MSCVTAWIATAVGVPAWEGSGKEPQSFYVLGVESPIMSCFALRARAISSKEMAAAESLILSSKPCGD